uniref:Uncharacterized mitochondrial protein AtMg00810-like n=1 Tax=Tanacetum cinerariifolium TaxID=118510 RepID=A0A6L2L6J8_TANCI|nr:uncharacterized mitochondrial protein AtMg00810-like [Tanacetum cinerariifolium]
MTSTTHIPGPVTTKEKAQKKNDVKARSMLLMALPNEHLMSFNQYKDAKSLVASIQIRFGGNKATKKNQKTLLKQMYENFSAPRLESLDFIFNRLQKIVSQLAILDTMSFDDLYNNFKIVEQEVKGTRNSSSSSNSQNMTFVSSPSSTNEVNTTYGVSTANTQANPSSTQVNNASTQVSNANLSDATVYGFLASQPNGSQLVHEDLEQIHEDDLEEMDLKWQLALLSMRANRGPRNQDSRNRYLDSSKRNVNMKETPLKAMVSIDRVGFDWIYMAEDEVPTNMSLMAFLDFEEFKQPEFEGYGPKSCEKDSKNASKDIPNELRKSPDSPLVKDRVTKNKDCSVESPVVVENKIDVPTIVKVKVVRPKQQEKPVRKPVKERVVSRNNYTRLHSNNYTRQTHPSAHMNMAPRAVLMKTGLRPLNTARTVNTAHPKTTVNSARPMSCLSKSAQSTIKRPYQQRTTLTNKSISQQVNTAKGIFYTARPRALNTARQRPVNTARPRAVNTARPNLVVVNDVRANQAICLISLTSRNLIEDMLPLGDEQMVAELLMCDKKNTVLFTDTGYFVLSPDFKLADESQVLLKVLRRNNMYSVDIKNIVLKESLTCLVAKATLDESMLCLMHKKYGFVVTDDDKNLVDKKVKVIRCDNGTEFKNSVMNDFYAMKGIKREFSVSRTPQQNSVAERRNKTLIEAARTMALVVKPHNKTPYELFRGRTPALSFMRPFGCHVTVLNTLDHLGKFDGKANKGYFVGFSMHNKAFRVYNIGTRRVEKNLHIEFLENKPSVVGAEPEWLFDIDMLTKSMNYVPVIAGTNSDDFARTKDRIGLSDDAGSPSSGDAGKKHDEVSDKESGASNELNYAFENLNTEYPDDLKMPGLETIATNDDFKEKANFTNLESSIHVKDADGDYVDVHLYRSMIGSLMYVTTSRPDIMYEVCVCARFQVIPKVSHLHVVKIIFRYLKGYPKLGLWYPRDSPFELVAYTDSDYAGASLDRKSTTRGCQFLESSLISWQYKKQTVVATSTIEAEYVAAASCCGQVPRFRIKCWILGIILCTL